VTWRLTPFFTLTMDTSTLERVEIRQQFEFAASHRLHCDELDEESNRSVFGKCNNAHGHGHNYRLEVAVTVPLPDEGRRPVFSVIDLERIVDERVVQRFDHTHLNLDVPEFASLNPSVEHIARTCYDLIGNAIQRPGVDLTRVTVWETEKTSATYPA
jgi:6-pyruvoyltetrahydropterin/6-carboxytetrahydropterin synthase